MYGEVEYAVTIMLSYESSVLSCAICLLSSAAVQTEIGLHLYVVSPLHVTNTRGKKWLCIIIYRHVYNIFFCRLCLVVFSVGLSFGVSSVTRLEERW